MTKQSRGFKTKPRLWLLDRFGPRDALGPRDDTLGVSWASNYDKQLSLKTRPFNDDQALSGLIRPLSKPRILVQG